MRHQTTNFNNPDAVDLGGGGHLGVTDGSRRLLKTQEKYS